MPYEWAICVTKRREVTFFDRMSTAALWVVLVSCITFLLQCVGCSQSLTPEEQVRAELSRLVQAVTKQDIQILQNALTTDFRGNQLVTKNQMVGLAYTYFQQNRTVTATTIQVTVVVHNDQARTLFKVMLTGSEDVLPQRLRWLEVTLNWVKVEEQWKIQSAVWRDVGAAETR